MPPQDLSTFSFDKISRYILTAVLFLLPLSFVAGGKIPLPYVKSAVLLFGVIAASIFYIIERIKQKKVIIPSLISLPLLILPLVYLVSSLTSVNRNASLIGIGFEMETFFFITLLSVFAILTSLLFREKKEINSLMGALFASFSLLLILHVLKLFFPSFLAFGMFGVPASSVIGRWNELGIVMGFFVPMCFFVLESLSPARPIKITVYGFMIVSMLFVALTNFSFSFQSFDVNLNIALGIFALIFFVRTFFKRGREVPAEGLANPSPFPVRRNISYPAAALLLMSVVIAIFGQSIQNQATSHFGIVYTEGRPTWASTIGIAKKVLPSRMLLGSGPNTFDYEWNMHKEPGINISDFWNTDFSFGVGYIPTALVTTGLLGLAAWILILVLTLYLGYKIYRIPAPDRASSFIKSSIVFGVIYFALIGSCYLPGPVTLSIWFALIGLLLSYGRLEGLLAERVLLIPENRSKKILSIAVLSIIGLAMLFFAYKYFLKVSASYYAASAIQASSTNVDTARGYILKSIQNDGNESAYYQILAQNDLLALGQLSSKINSKNIEEFRPAIQSLIDETVRASLYGEKVDPTNYRAVIATGGVFETLATYGAPDSYDAALGKYSSAKQMSPMSPLPDLLSARVMARKNDLDKSKTFIANAINLKANYTDAYLLLSQIALNEGNRSAAMTILQNVTIIDPRNIETAYQFALMNYQDKKYETAITYFRKAIALDSSFANAHYFLALSLYSSGDKEGALAELAQVLVTNPNNADVESLIQKIKSGKPIFEVGPPPDEDTSSTTDKEVIPKKSAKK